MRVGAIMVVCFLSLSASAQEITDTARAQACLSKLLETTQRELDIRAQAITWQHDLEGLKARVKMLEDKYEPKK